jgi:glycosyltransferase involved in cell wall biosynthesis
MHVIAGLSAEDGGPPQACLHICRELARLGNHVAIYTSDADLKVDASGQALLSQNIEGVTIKRFPLQFDPAAYAFSFPFAAALKRVIPTYDVVHINSLYKFPSTVAASYCRRYKVPYLIRPHGTLDPYHFRRHRLLKSIYEWLVEWRNLERAAAVQFTSVEEMELARPLGLRIRSVVVPLAVDLTECGITRPSGRFCSIWPQTLGKRLIVFLGRLSVKKGLELLVQAFAQIARERDDLHLVIAGPDNEGYGMQVRKCLMREDVLTKATFTGILVGDDKRDLLRDAELFVLPSYSENFGLAAVEAMAAGLPLVISNKVNIWRELEQAGAGLVVECDAHALAGAMRELLENRKVAKKMGERARRLVHQRFSCEVVARQMLGLYHDIASRRPQTLH